MSIHIGWPQGIFLALVFLATLANAITFTLRRQYANVAGVVLGLFLTLGLLYWGGFFAGVRP